MSENNKTKSFLFGLIITVITAVVTLAAAEVLLRVKNSDGKNYHIEMWKYSKVLKKRSDNPVLGHEHIPNKEAVLQNVNIRINEKGMRGGDFPAAEAGQRRVLLIGSSATLGWGVEEDETLAARLQAMFDQAGQKAAVMNAGIGNYNAQRYVELFLSKNTDVKPTDLVVNYYLNDAEDLKPGGGNIFIRNSQLAVTFWILSNRLRGRFGHGDLKSHYSSIYENDFSGFIKMKASLKALAAFAKVHNINLYLMMMPEVHDLSDYQYGFAHEIMEDLAEEYGYEYVDALPAFQKIEDAQSLWAMPGDPHPNGAAHGLFAEVLYPRLAQEKIP